MLQDELRYLRLALGLSPLQGGVLGFKVEQLGVGPGSQQGLHARHVPLGRGQHECGVAVDVLHVRAGRVLQEEEHCGDVAVARSLHERGAASARERVGLQIDARASLQQPLHHLQMAGGCAGMQQSYFYGLTFRGWMGAERVDRPSLAQPLEHREQIARCGGPEDLIGKRGGRGLRCLAIEGWGVRMQRWQRCPFGYIKR
mmetsp:Transcript_6470/g.15990  ORF Transcript_6470/g.15990 Transcript_6470/m.15990 type:complete len:200 (-) Transcript_6470:285-884(-)